MPRQLNPEDSTRLADWIARVSSALAVDVEVPVDELLELGSDVAHEVLRPATPVTGFLLGAALATSPDATPDEVVARVRSVLTTFPPLAGDSAAGSTPKPRAAE